MKPIYDANTDTVTVELRTAPITESEESKPGVILDYDSDDNLVSLEILDVSKRINEARRMQFQVA